MNIVTKSDLFSEEEISKIEAHYDAQFVCETCVKGNHGWVNTNMAVFYQEDLAKVPEGGSQYFALYFRPENMDGSGKMHLMITNAISALEPFDGIVAHNGDVIYSRYRHDYRSSPDGSVWVDGGRDYLRHSGNGTPVSLAIKNGKLQVNAPWPDAKR